MILKCTLMEHFNIVDRYATRAKHARLLASNFGGDTVAERMREATALRSSRPNLKKVVGHIILSHDPTLADLTDEQWLLVMEIAKQEHDLRDAAFCAVLHLEKKHRHLHLYYMRCRPDGSLVSDSQSFKKNTTAARRIEGALNLPAPTPVPKNERVGDRRAADNATRRGRRKQQTKGEVFMDLPELRTRVERALAGSDSVDKFSVLLAAEGVDVHWTGNYAGVKYKPTGASTWHKGSTLHRDLAARGVLLVIERNAELRAAAKQSATAAVGVADDRARALADARLARNEVLDEVTTAPGVPVRALPAAEADAARALAQAGPDPLDFLVPPEPVPAALDDAPLTVTAQAATTSAETADDHLARQQRAAADDAQAELAAALRKLAAKQLVELRNAARRPLDEAILMAALIEKLLQLALRLLTLGGYKRSTPISDLLASKQAVGAAAEEELSRRRRTPERVADRLSALAEHEAALQSRKLSLDAQKNAADLAALYAVPPPIAVRQQVTEAFDRAQAADGKPTTVQLRAEIEELDQKIELISAQHRPAGFLSKFPLGSAAARARAAEHAAAQESLRRNRQRREHAAEQLARYLAAIERIVVQQEAAKAAKLDEERKILSDEAEALAIEIRDRVPEWRKEIEAEARRERIGKSVDDEGSPDSDADARARAAMWHRK